MKMLFFLDMRSEERGMKYLKEAVETMAKRQNSLLSLQG
jgi:hypothetical protein